MRIINWKKGQWTANRVIILVIGIIAIVHAIWGW
jgi:hypothetical protein